METNPFDAFRDAEVIEIIESDDKERFLTLLSAYAHTVETMNVVMMCAWSRAKKCLLALIQGEAGVTAHQIYARAAAKQPQVPTPLACVVYFFLDADDLIDLLLKKGPVDHANIKCEPYDEYTFDGRITCPLDHALLSLSYKPHLLPWASGDSLIKLTILLCQWESKPSLTCARLLAPHTDGLNNIAWSYVQQGKLASLAALLLVAQEKVLVPFGSGLTIRQRIMGMVQKLTPENDLDYEGAIYRSMLIEACKLFDIFERAGGALSLYCSSMHEYVPPHKVLSDVASLLKKAGHALEPRDVDLRDCYRDCAEFKNASVFKLSDPESPEKKYCLPSSLTRAQDFGATRHSYPYPGTCQLFHNLKLGQVLSMKNPSASEPRLLRTAAGQVDNGGSGIPRKHLAYIAFRLKRGIKF